MGYHMGSGRLMQFESNWYANRYKILCKWKDCPMADQPFTTMKGMYDHLEQDHFQPPPVPPEVLSAPQTDESPPKRPPKHTMLQCRWVGCDGPRYPDAELLRQHVDQHFGGALRALWQPAESMMEVRRALSVLVQTPSAENEPAAAAEDEEDSQFDDEEEEEFDGWRLEWDCRNQHQEQPAAQQIAQAQMEASPAPKRRGRKAADDGASAANLLPEQILETDRDDLTHSTPKRRTAGEAAAAAAVAPGESEPAPETVETPSTEIRRSGRAKKPTVRFLEAKRVGDSSIDAENDEDVGDGDDDLPLELRKKARKLPRRRSLKGEKRDQLELQQLGSGAQDALIVMDVPSPDQKRRRMRQNFRQHVLFVPEVRSCFHFAIFLNNIVSKSGKKVKGLFSGYVFLKYRRFIS